MHEKPVKIKCDSCQALVINQMACHEIGCPESHINLVTGEIIKRTCKWCGGDFTPDDKDQHFCSESCAEAFHV